MTERKEAFEVLVNKFTEESARQFRADLLSGAKGDRKKPVIVWIDSNGGDVDALATMVETIKSVPNEIITVCVGKAMSCGAILLSFGNRRYCGEYSRVMVHEFLSSASMQNVHETSITAKESARLNIYWLGQLAKNCKIKGGYIGLRALIKKSEDDRTIYLDAKSALKFGIVDFVGVPEVESITTHKVQVATRKQKKSPN